MAAPIFPPASRSTNVPSVMSTTSAPSAQQQQQQQIDISTLPVQQLQQIKKQLDAEVSHLTQSYSSLRTAQVKFRDCITSINTGVRPQTAPAPSASSSAAAAAVAGSVQNSAVDETERRVLVPLTTSLYVPGTLARGETVMVDVGTGFYVRKSCDEAVAFYEGKVKELGANVDGLEKVVQGKRGNLRVVEDVLRSRMLEQGQQGQGQGQGQAAR